MNISDAICIVAEIERSEAKVFVHKSRNEGESSTVLLEHFGSSHQLCYCRAENAARSYSHAKGVSV